MLWSQSLYIEKTTEAKKSPHWEEWIKAQTLLFVTMSNSKARDAYSGIRKKKHHSDPEHSSAFREKTEKKGKNWSRRPTRNCGRWAKSPIYPIRSLSHSNLPLHQNQQPRLEELLSCQSRASQKLAPWRQVATCLLLVLLLGLPDYLDNTLVRARPFIWRGCGHREQHGGHGGVSRISGGSRTTEQVWALPSLVRALLDVITEKRFEPFLACISSNRKSAVITNTRRRRIMGKVAIILNNGEHRRCPKLLWRTLIFEKYTCK